MVLIGIDEHDGMKRRPLNAISDYKRSIDALNIHYKYTIMYRNKKKETQYLEEQITPKMLGKLSDFQLYWEDGDIDEFIEHVIEYIDKSTNNFDR